jgi:hypothetical protein
MHPYGRRISPARVHRSRRHLRPAAGSFTSLRYLQDDGVRRRGSRSGKVPFHYRMTNYADASLEFKVGLCFPYSSETGSGWSKTAKYLAFSVAR